MAMQTSVYERLMGGNRKQRKDLQRRLCSDDPGLGVVHANAAGIDIGNESHFVAVPAGRDAEPVREFGSWTADLERMAAWLQSCGIETVAMQSTGVYWFAVYDVLEKRGLQVFLVNASHTKNLPGRKSDVQESQWLMKLHTYGLLRNSFRPPEEIRPIRAGVAVAGPARGRGRAQYSTHAEIADIDERSVGQRHQRCRWGVGTSHHSLDPGRRAGCAPIGPVARPPHQSQRGGSGAEPGGNLAGRSVVRTPAGRR